jgi:hypothetical protein
MKHEPPDKLHSREHHHFFLVPVGIVSPFECDPAVLDVQDPVVGNRHPVGISAKIVNANSHTIQIMMKKQKLITTRTMRHFFFQPNQSSESKEISGPRNGDSTEWE